MGVTVSTGPTLLKVYDSGELTAATDTLDITGLDLDTAFVYDLEAIIQNDNAALASWSMYMNNDLVAGNYETQFNSCFGAAQAPARNADAIFATMNAGMGAMLVAKISKSPDGYPRAWCETLGKDPGAVALNIQWAHVCRNNVAAITQLNLRSSVADGFGVGSRFKLWRKMQ